jgi:hypothetical protein
LRLVIFENLTGAAIAVGDILVTHPQIAG